MNWKKFTLIGSVALATITLPIATAQAQGRGGRSGGSAHSVSSARGSGFASRSGHFGNGRYGGRYGRYRGGYYYSGLYPFGFGYPFGYGYGYGYGYPYYGASSALYYGGGYGGYGYGGNGYGGGYNYGGRGGRNIAAGVQQELAKAGYYHGEIDGVIGDGTRRAIRRYERANGLPVDGRIDRQLLETMDLS